LRVKPWLLFLPSLVLVLFNAALPICNVISYSLHNLFPSVPLCGSAGTISEAPPRPGFPQRAVQGTVVFRRVSSHRNTARLGDRARAPEERSLWGGRPGDHFNSIGDPMDDRGSHVALLQSLSYYDDLTRKNGSSSSLAKPGAQPSESAPKVPTNDAIASKSQTVCLSAFDTPWRTACLPARSKTRLGFTQRTGQPKPSENTILCLSVRSGMRKTPPFDGTAPIQRLFAPVGQPRSERKRALEPGAYWFFR